MADKNVSFLTTLIKALIYSLLKFSKYWLFKHLQLFISPIEFFRSYFMSFEKISKIAENTIKWQVLKKPKACTINRLILFIKLPLPPCYHAFLLSTHPYLSKYYCCLEFAPQFGMECPKLRSMLTDY